MIVILIIKKHLGRFICPFCRGWRPYLGSIPKAVFVPLWGFYTLLLAYKKIIERGLCVDWLQDVIREYVTKNEIRTTEENMQRLKDYYVKQGYDSLYIVCNALIADNKTLEILLNKD